MGQLDLQSLDRVSTRLARLRPLLRGVQWGPHGERKRTSTTYWRQPLAWNADGAHFLRQHGHRHRVFCASLADWLDNQVPQQWREDLGHLIEQTPNLDWLLLTKRIQNFSKLAPSRWREGPPANVWLGTTTECQEYYDSRWPVLARINARVRFISYEPAVGPLVPSEANGIYPDWVICGGESGPHARTMNPQWARDCRDKCAALGIAYFLKQWGTWKSNPSPKSDSSKHGKGGGLLDGRLWREAPSVRLATDQRMSDPRR